MQVGAILFGALFAVSVCWAAGRLLLRALAVRLHAAEWNIFAFAAGSACWSTVVFLLAAAGVVRRGVFLIAGLLVIAASLKWGRPIPADSKALPRLPTYWRVLSGAVFAAFTLLYFFNAMAPEVSPDGSAYHLGCVARYMREHGFHRVTTNMYANLSQGLEMLFLFAFAFGRHSAASLVHFAFLLALPLAMLSYGRRFGFPKAAATGALLMYASPVAGIAGTCAYNDVAVACILFTVFYLLEIWEEERQTALLVPAGLLAGFAFAIKYTAFLAVPYALGRVAWCLWRGGRGGSGAAAVRQRALPRLALVAACALLMMSPWIAKNWIWFGNPVSPFLNNVFPNPYVRVSTEREYAARMRKDNYGLKSYRDIPMEATVRGGLLQGFAGPVFLLAPLALLALRRREGRSLLLAGAVFGLTYATNVGTRFLLPSLPFVSLAMGLAAANSKGIAPALVLAHALFSWPNVMRIYADQYAWRLDGIPFKAALRRIPEAQYVDEKLWGHAIARLIDEKTPPGSKVFTNDGVPDAYTSREILVGYQAALNNTLSDVLLIPLIGDLQPVWRLEFRFPAESIRKLRLVETARAGAQLGINELRVFASGQELARAPAWRLRAHPNPWDVQMAFDNALVTRWRSWQATAPGMYLEIDFGRLERIDSVVVECSPDQAAAQFKVEGELAAGSWKALADKFDRSAIPYPQGLRRAAAEELKARGVDYVLVNDSDFMSKDFWTYRRTWGLTELGYVHGARLYRVD